MKREHVGTLSAKDVGRRVLLRGWVHRRRDLGGVFFIDLRDRSGLVQLLVPPDDGNAAHAALDPVRAEWVVEVEGLVAARAEGNVNREMATGEIEVAVDRAVVLAPSDVPPFTPDGKVEASEETRLRYRYLDLRRPELQRNLLLRDKVSLAVRQVLHDQGFVDLETPILTRSTPEGARDYLVPSRIHRGEFYALPQSPQIFKQILMISGFEKYFQIARCFRDEDLRAERQPEFTQIDLEMSFVEPEDVYEVVEGLFGAIFPLSGIEPPAKFPRMTYDEAMRRFGSDRPDLRFGMEIVDLGDLLGGSGFRGFRAAVEEGGVIRGIVLPGMAGASRKVLDGWAQIAQRHGAAGVLALRRRDGELIFQVKTALTDAEKEAVAERLELAEGDLALLAAGPASTTSKALGALRTEMGRELDLIDPGRHEFLWITDFPLVEWNEDEERWDSLHHPFTSPDPRDLELMESDPGAVRSLAYDVVMDGLELGGGSIRIHRKDLQQKVFALLGIDEAEAERRFGFLLEALRYGAPPHGGIAFGLDRIVMMMAGTSAIRDVIPFPKTTSATCLMTEAPSGVDTRQLGELALRVVASSTDGDD